MVSRIEKNSNMDHQSLSFLDARFVVFQKKWGKNPEENWPREWSNQAIPDFQESMVIIPIRFLSP